jgi:hypothetical protein
MLHFHDDVLLVHAHPKPSTSSAGSAVALVPDVFVTNPQQQRCGMLMPDIPESMRVSIPWKRSFTMMMNKSLKTTALILIASMSFASLPVQAMVMTTAEVTAPLQVVSAERARVAALLARADVQSGLARYGVSSEQAAARVASLSDDEVMQLGQRLDTVPAGGDIIGVVVFIFLVLLITDILGFTKIFPFTRSIR